MAACSIFEEDEVFIFDEKGYRCGLVLESAEYASSDEEDDPMDFTKFDYERVQKGTVRVAWHPDGEEQVVQENKVIQLPAIGLLHMCHMCNNTWQMTPQCQANCDCIPAYGCWGQNLDVSWLFFHVNLKTEILTVSALFAISEVLTFRWWFSHIQILLWYMLTPPTIQEHRAVNVYYSLVSCNISTNWSQLFLENLSTCL